MFVAIPAPALAVEASPLAVATTLLIAVRDKLPPAAMELVPETLAIAELSISKIATAASLAVSICELNPFAIAEPLTTELLAIVTLPLPSIRESTREIVAVESKATSAAILSREPDTVEVAEILILPALRVAPFKLTCALPLAKIPSWVSAAVKVISPFAPALVASITTPVATLIASALTVKLPPLRLIFLAKATVSLPEPPRISKEVPDGSNQFTVIVSSPAPASTVNLPMGAN